MLITREQKSEIVGLLPEHGGALLAYGAEMYQQGTRAGVLSVGAVALGVVACGIAYKRLTKKPMES